MLHIITPETLLTFLNVLDINEDLWLWRILISLLHEITCQWSIGFMEYCFGSDGSG